MCCGLMLRWKTIDVACSLIIIEFDIWQKFGIFIISLKFKLDISISSKKAQLLNINMNQKFSLHAFGWNFTV